MYYFESLQSLHQVRYDVHRPIILQNNATHVLLSTTTPIHFWVKIYEPRVAPPAGLQTVRPTSLANTMDR